MSAVIQVRKLPDGRLQARRLDGEPMTAADRQEAKRLAGAETAKAEATPRAGVIEEITEPATGELRAVKICSALLETHLWVLHDRDFIPPDDDPIFFADEFEFLKTKSIEQMREVLKVKNVFPRARVVQ
ncbi:MAG: hypothetical protein Q8S00_04220 [Deltaproteobacteria bacterium]|nr:hypothetical protein [Deltaproteobacteria bacterium]